MVSWVEFAEVEPSLASDVRSLMCQYGAGLGYLATVRPDGGPRVHPVAPVITDEGLFCFIVPSPKRHDLDRDGRYALHTHMDQAAPNEFALRGRARLVDDPEERGRVATGWAFEVDDSYTLFEFSIENAVLGARATADDWPPIYTSWRASS